MAIARNCKDGMPDIRPDIIRAVKARPALWMSSHPHHKAKVFHQEYWLQVVAELPASPKINVESVKKQWKNLKDTYRKEIRRPFLQWKFCEEMSFMKEELKNCRRPGSPSGWTQNDFPSTCEVQVLQSQGENSKDSFERDGKEQIIFETDSFVWSPKKSPVDPFSDSEPASSHAAVNQSAFLEKLAKNDELAYPSTSAPQPDSEDFHFLMSMLPEMEKLPPLQKMRLRTKINEALLEEMSIVYQNQDTVTKGKTTDAKKETDKKSSPKLKRKRQTK